MKTLPIPQPVALRLKLAYDVLMCDDLPIDFDKVSELIQAAGAVVRAVEVLPQPPRVPRRVVINGTRYIKS